MARKLTKADITGMEALMRSSPDETMLTLPTWLFRGYVERTYQAGRNSMNNLYSEAGKKGRATRQKHLDERKRKQEAWLKKTTLTPKKKQRKDKA